MLPLIENEPYRRLFIRERQEKDGKMLTVGWAKKQRKEEVWLVMCPFKSKKRHSMKCQEAWQTHWAIRFI